MRTIIAQIEWNLLQTGEPNTINWIGRKYGEYTVQSCYYRLKNIDDLQNGWPLKAIWKTNVSTRAAVIEWITVNNACVGA